MGYKMVMIIRKLLLKYQDKLRKLFTSGRDKWGLSGWLVILF